MESGVSKNP